MRVEGWGCLMSEQEKTFGGSAPNFLDRALSWVHPAGAVRRLQAREVLRQFGWDGAKRTTERGRARAADNQNPETTRMTRARHELAVEAREMYRNSPLVRGVTDRICNYTLGRLTYKARTGDAEVDKQIETYFHEWCHRCDWTGRFTFRKIVELALRAYIVDGDHLVLPLRDVRTDPKTGVVTGDGEPRLQNVDADRIGDPNKIGCDQGRPHGIFLGERGEIAEFDLYKCDQNNRYTPDKKVKAAQAYFLCDPFRATMYRGVSLLGTAIPRARDLYEAIRLEMAAAKTASAFAGFLQEGSRGTAVDWDDKPGGTAAADDPKSLEMVPGRLQKLTGSGTLTLAEPTARPSGAFLNLMDVLQREVANSIDMPFGFTGRLGDLGGVTQRIEVMQAVRRFDFFRRLLEDAILNKVRDLVLDYGLATGKIPYHKKYKEGHWLYGAHLTADVGHDTNARLAMLQAGLTTKTREAGHLFGDDYSALVDEGRAEVDLQRKVAEESGIPIELLPGGHAQATMLLAGKAEGEEIDAAGGAAASEQEAAAAAAEPPKVAAVRDTKELKGVLDLIRSYNRGEITRDQAVTLLVTQWQMDLAEADQLVV
mgnify:CR=1 FL=1